MTKLASLALLVGVACGPSKADNDNAQKAVETTTPAAPAPPSPPPAPKVPALSPLALEAWGIELDAPAGTRIIDLEPGDAELKMPDSAKVAAEASCGWDIDLNRHWKADFVSFYQAGKEDTLADLKVLVDEKTGDRFKIHYVGNAPIGPMWGVETGFVAGDRLVLCSAGMNRLTEQEAACVLAVCGSIRAKQ